MTDKCEACRKYLIDGKCLTPDCPNHHLAKGKVQSQLFQDGPDTVFVGSKTDAIDLLKALREKAKKGEL